MPTKEVRELKKKAAGAEWKNFKIAWQHLSWSWRIIFIIGIITTIRLVYNLGVLIRSLLTG